MIQAKQGKEIVVVTVNQIGSLAEISKLVADRGVNILGLCGWVEGQDAVFRMVTDDNLRAGDALRSKHYSIREKDVVLVELPHKPGMLRSIIQRLSAENIDIHHIYASATLDMHKSLVALATANNDRAVVLLNG